MQKSRAYVKTIIWVIAFPVLKVLSMLKILKRPKFPILVLQLNTSLRLSLVLSILVEIWKR